VGCRGVGFIGYSWWLGFFIGYSIGYSWWLGFWNSTRHSHLGVVMKKIIGWAMIAISVLAMLLLWGFIHKDYATPFICFGICGFLVGWVLLILYLLTGSWKYLKD